MHSKEVGPLVPHVRAVVPGTKRKEVVYRFGCFLAKELEVDATYVFPVKFDVKVGLQKDNG